MYMATDKDKCVFHFSFIHVAMNQVVINFMTVIPHTPPPDVCAMSVFLTLFGHMIYEVITANQRWNQQKNLYSSTQTLTSRAASNDYFHN